MHIPLARYRFTARVQECLALIRQAFVHAFLPSAEREALLKQVDVQVFTLMAKNGRIC